MKAVFPEPVDEFGGDACHAEPGALCPQEIGCEPRDSPAFLCGRINGAGGLASCSPYGLILALFCNNLAESALPVAKP
jgi:hypothetical protein